MLESYLVQLEPGGVWVWVQALGDGSGYGLWVQIMGSGYGFGLGSDYWFGLRVRILGEP